jgi:probable HAF family extracellular repeat protein
MKTSWPSPISLIFLLLFTSAAFSQKPYSVYSIPGISPNSQIAINNNGEVVVNTASTTSNQVSAWTRLAGPKAIASFAVNSIGNAINLSGEIAGVGTPSGSSSSQAFVWTPSGAVWLGSLGGKYGAANAINDAAAVVGQSYTSSYLQHAFLWTPSAGMRDITPNLTSSGGATATGINSSNEVVGYYFPNGSNSTVGFTWTATGNLANFGPAGTLAFAINNAGTVVGRSPDAAGYSHAFSFTSATGIKDLGTLGGDASSALSINNEGSIVGTSIANTTSGLITHGFMWTSSAGMRDLSNLSTLGVAQRPYALQINDYGVIAVSTNVGGYVLVPKMSTTVTSSANPSVVGQAVTFTATISSIAGPPPDGELLQFVVGGKTMGSVAMKGGVAKFTTSAIAEGSRVVAAKYSGDANYYPAKFTTITQQVNP